MRLSTPAEVLARWAGTRVAVARNLNVRDPDDPTRPVWTLRARVDGRERVVAATTHVVLTDPQCRIRRSGQARARAEHQRNVHALVVGVLTAAGAAAWPEPLVEVRYDLYGTGEFIDPSGTPIAGGRLAVLDHTGLHIAGARIIAPS